MAFDQIDELRRDTVDLRKDMSSVGRNVAALTERVGQKADKGELHEFKEAVFARIKVEVAEALQQNDERTVEKLKRFGHDIAVEIEREVGRQLTSRDATSKQIEAARKEAREEVLKEVAEGSGKVRWSTRTTAIVVMLATLGGALFGQYLLPLLLKELFKRFTGL